MNAPALKLSDLELTATEAKLVHEALIHTILGILVRYGGEGFRRWKSDLEETQPHSQETIDVHSTPIHPLPAMEIDENSMTGNVEVIETILSELQLDSTSPDFTRHVKIIAGDQLTIARQRSILNVRTGHEDGADAWNHIVLMPGLFHAKIADCHGLLQTHFGSSSVRNPGSLAFHNQRLDRIPIVLSSLPPYRQCRDLILISLYARVRDCLLKVSGCESTNDYLEKFNSWSAIRAHAEQIFKSFANADRVQELRESRVAEERRREVEEKERAKGKGKEKERDPETAASSSHIAKGDMVFENACLFMRDALLTRLFSDAVKAGDSGLVVAVLKLWALGYRGSGRSKYAHEMLHLLHNLINVWSKRLRYVCMSLTCSIQV